MRWLILDNIAFVVSVAVFAHITEQPEHEWLVLPMFAIDCFALYKSVTIKQYDRKLKMRKMKNKSKLFSTPIRFYILALLASTILVLLYCFSENTESSKTGTILISIGSGIFASVLVAAWIDYGNTKREHYKNQEIIRRLTSNLRTQCAYLPTFLSAGIDRCKTEGKISVKKEAFVEEMLALFLANEENSNDETIQSAVKTVTYRLLSIKREADSITEKYDFYYSVDAYNQDFLSKVKTLSNRSESLYNEFDIPFVFNSLSRKRREVQHFTEAVSDLFPENMVVYLGSTEKVGNMSIEETPLY